MTPGGRTGRMLAAAAVVVLLSGCMRPEPAWTTRDVTGFLPDLAFHLTDESGREVTARDYRGKVLALYFGYTHCPDVCPMTLGTLHLALQAMGAKADGVRVLFVSVDPQRDTTRRLATYVDAFGEGFVGLRGSDRQLIDLTRRFRVTYGLGQPDRQGDYEVRHSSAVWIFDGDGRARLIARQGNDPAVLARALGSLLDKRSQSGARCVRRGSTPRSRSLVSCPHRPGAAQPAALRPPASAGNPGFGRSRPASCRRAGSRPPPSRAPAGAARRSA